MFSPEIEAQIQALEPASRCEVLRVSSEWMLLMQSRAVSTEEIRRVLETPVWGKVAINAFEDLLKRNAPVND